MGFKANKNFTVLTFQNLQIQGSAVFQMHKANNCQKWLYKAMYKDYHSLSSYLFI